MDTVEIVVYIVVAFLIEGLVLLFIGRIDAGKLYTGVRDKIFHKEEAAYEKLPPDEASLAAYKVWERCGFGVQPGNMTLYITGTGDFNRTTMFTQFRKLNFCSSIQSQAEGCGNREDLNITRPITLPSVVRVRCDTTLRQLVVE